MHERASLGRRGEDAAVRFLEGRGYKILARNYRIRDGEIDIIAADKSTLHFIEVKTRRNLNYDRPAAAVNYTKRQKIRRTALCFLAEHPEMNEAELAFDVVELLVEGDKAHLNFLQACF